MRLRTPSWRLGADLAGEAIGGLADREVVVVGAGTMASLAVKHLRGPRRGLESASSTDRSSTLARSRPARSAEHGELDDLPEAMRRADLVVSATGAAGTVIERSAVAEAVAGSARASAGAARPRRAARRGAGDGRAPTASRVIDIDIAARAPVAEHDGRDAERHREGPRDRGESEVAPLRRAPPWRSSSLLSIRAMRSPRRAGRARRAGPLRVTARRAHARRAGGRRGARARHRGQAPARPASWP